MYIVPAPSLVTLSNISNSIHLIGSNITLNCTVELSPAMDVPVTVNTEWTGPVGVTLSPTDPLMESANRYTSTAVVSSFWRQQSEDYFCSASISSTSLEPFLVSSATTTGRGRIAVGKAARNMLDNSNNY